MNDKLEVLNQIIRQHRSVFPKFYTDRAIPDSVILEMLENANWAPTHKRTEPWRFKVIKGPGLIKLSTFLGENYKRNTQPDTFIPKKYEKIRKKPLQSAAVIAICMQRDPDHRVPEWEEIAAVSCAVQNLWLTAWAHGIGGYWSTPGAMKNMNEFLNLSTGEKCLGLFYLGYFDQKEMKGNRVPIQDKVKWITD